MARLNKLRRALRYLGFRESTSKNYYQCRHCGYILPKKEAIISGYDSIHLL